MTFQICSINDCRCIHHLILENLKKENNNDRVKSLLKDVKNFQQLVDNSGQTLLHYAAKYGNEEMVKYLINNGCDVNARDHQGYNALTLVLTDFTQEGTNARIAEILLKSNVDIYKSKNILQLVLRKTMHAYFICKKSSYQPIMETIFKKLNSDFLTNNREKVLSLLSSAENSAKLTAVVFGNSELAKFLLKDNYPLNFKENTAGCTALHCAIIFKRINNAKILIDQGADISIVNNCIGVPSYYYLDNCEDVDEDFELLKSLVRLSIKHSHSYGWEIVIRLLKNGNKQIVEAVLQSNYDLSYKNDKYITSLLFSNKNHDVLELLGELGIDEGASEDNITFLIETLQRNIITGIERNVITALLALLVVIHKSFFTNYYRRRLNDTDQPRFDLCTQQLEEMKNIEIRNGISLFELLNETDEKKIITYARNQKFIKAIKNAMKRPIDEYYLKILQTRVGKALDKIELDEKASSTIQVLTGMCSDVIFAIMVYLSPIDLKNLCRA